jgi:hypothetical protein
MAVIQIIGGYYYAEFIEEADKLSLSEVVRFLSTKLLGLYAVNVSWDSGRLTPTDEQIATGWKIVDGYACTPELDEELLTAWPHNTCVDGFYDEWYFFRSLPSKIELHAYCNYMCSISEWPRMADIPGRFNLSQQLQFARPEFALGEGSGGLFLISRERSAIETFVKLGESRC